MECSEDPEDIVMTKLQTEQSSGFGCLLKKCQDLQLMDNNEQLCLTTTNSTT